MAFPDKEAIGEGHDQAMEDTTKQQEEDPICAIEAKLAEWLAIEARVQSALAEVPHLITLDVGGTLFKVPKETLLQEEGSYFHALLGSGHWKPDTTNGAYYLNLHGGTFDRVLTFLRTRRLWTEGLNLYDRAQLRASMSYLYLSAPSLAWDADKCAPQIVLSAENATASKSSPGKWVSVLGNTPVSSFRLHLIELGTGTYVGLCPRANFDVGGNGQGYYIRLPNGVKSTLGTLKTQTTKYSDEAFETGDIVAVRLSDAGNVHFEKNGRDLGAAFTVEDPSVDLYPVVVMYKNDVVKFVPL
ncbi:Aste57867_624 [Aphanomyces stellatus]|uniref:Aste57867_624 protein n=1 Tax=Aphanomyces stellatus TaxID=120398 RepID=A0A485K8A8_9STRA|nr:hypothetical protein As57867_000623 [Aphanomyces stellatus]VFT77849.1 Aste57867_624 [Aphanomyces stellatus]